MSAQDRQRSRQLRHRLLLEEEARTSDGMGGYAVSWQPVRFVWGEIVEASVTARTRLTAGQRLPEYGCFIRVRRQHRLRVGQRLSYGGRRFLIQSIEDDGAGALIALHTVEAPL